MIRNIGSYIFQSNEGFDNQNKQYDTDERIFLSKKFNDNYLNGLISKRRVISNYFLQSENSVQSNLDITGINFHQDKQYSNFLYFKLSKKILKSTNNSMTVWVRSLYDSGNPLLINYQINQNVETISLPNIDLNKVKYINIVSDTNPSSIELDYVK